MSVDIAQLVQAFKDYVRLDKPVGSLDIQLNQFCNKYPSIRLYKDLIRQKLMQE